MKRQPVSRARIRTRWQIPPEALKRIHDLALVALGVYFVWNSLYFFPNIVDDAYISLRYAENLAQGRGLVYNPGQYVEGYSNFSWVMLEALILYLGLPAVTFIKCLGLLFGLSAVALTYVLGRVLFSSQPYGRMKSLIGAGLLCLNTSIALWSQGGLETSLLTLLLVAMCLRYELELEQERALPLSGILFALAWMTRPEAPVYGLYFLVRRFCLRKQRLWSKTDLWWILAVGAILVPYEFWGLWYYGKLLPSTHAAKIGETGWMGMSHLVPRFLHQPLLYQFLTRQGWGLPAMLLLGAMGCTMGRKTLPLTIWLIPLCGLIFIFYAQHDWMPRYRFFVPILPFIFLCVGYGLFELLRPVRHSRMLSVVCFLVCALVCLEYSRFQAFGGEEKTQGGSFAVVEKERGLWFLEVLDRLSLRIYPLEQSAYFLLSRVPPGEYICLRDIGFAGYVTMNPIWDTAGLITPSVARARHDQSEEAQRAMLEDLMAVRPACILLYLYAPPYINDRIHEFLQSDESARALYTQYRVVSPRPARVKKDTWLAIYLRNGLPEVDLKRRLGMVAARLPDYEGRLRALSGLQEIPTRKH